MQRCTTTFRTTNTSSSFQTAHRSRWRCQPVLKPFHAFSPNPPENMPNCSPGVQRSVPPTQLLRPLVRLPEPGDPCSASTLASDGHSLGLTADQASGKVRALRLIFSHLIFTLFPPQPNQPHLPFKVLTLAKTCEEVESIRTCDQNRDWSILALQNIRTGKAHYLVICTCPDSGFLGKIS